MRYLVTGANRGIGLEFVRALLARGDDVVATAREPDRAEALQALREDAGERLTIVALDVTDEDSLGALASALRGEALDVVVNSAGVLLRAGSVGELDYDVMRQSFEVNTLGPLRVVEATLPALARGQRKLLVHVTSKMGSIADNTSGGGYAYRMSKAALNMAIRSLAQDLAARDVVTFVLHPGWVKTDMGGPNALITVEQSVTGMLQVMDGADEAASGRFWEWNGKEVAW